VVEEAMNQGRRGARAENQVADQLRELGYDVIRSAASKGAADLVAVSERWVLFVQVKICPVDKAYTQLSPAERTQLVRVATRVPGGHGFPVVAQVRPGSGGRPAVIEYYQLTSDHPSDHWCWDLAAVPGGEYACVTQCG
jgi:Holliday junction resolvase